MDGLFDVASLLCLVYLKLTHMYLRPHVYGHGEESQTIADIGYDSPALFESMFLE